MMIIKDKFQKGFTILEMLISILVITLGIVGIFTAVIKYNQFTQQIRDNFIASHLAQEGIEIVKNIRDTNWTSGNSWDTGLSSCSSGCEADYTNTTLSSWTAPGRSLYIENSTGLYKYITSPGASDTQTMFTRKITVTVVSSSEIDISVDVYWSGNTATVKENIYNWKP